MQLSSVVAERGFAIVPDLLAQNEAKLLLDGLGTSGLRHSRAGVRHALRHLAVRDVANDLRLLSIAKEILGGVALPFRATLFDKSILSNWLIVWHQDTALPLRDRCSVQGWGPWSIKEGVTYAHAPAEALDKVIALRIHLDESTERNGPLRVLPATHKSGVLTDDQILQVAHQIPAIDCLVPCGGIVVMRPLLIHSSSKCESANPRRVLHIEYASSLNLAEGIELAIA